MNLPPLPLTDGALLIDNSTLELFTCYRKAEYKWLRGRVRDTDKAGANFGSGVHVGLDQRYALSGTGPVSQATRIALDTAMHKHFDSSPAPDGDFRDFNHACKMLTAYLKNYPTESFEILQGPKGPIIESSFMYPFAVALLDAAGTWHVIPWDEKPENNFKWVGVVCVVHIYYTGKIDLGIRDHNGIWSFDHKTTFMFGQGFDQQMSMDGGQLGYCWALRKATGIMPIGYIIDAIRVRKPSRKGAIAEDYEGIAPIDASDFVRKPFWITKDTLDEWEQNTMALLSQIFNTHQSDYMPMVRSQCVGKYGACEFIEVCSIPRNQRLEFLSSGMFTDNLWKAGLKQENK